MTQSQLSDELKEQIKVAYRAFIATGPDKAAECKAFTEANSIPGFVDMTKGQAELLLAYLTEEREENGQPDWQQFDKPMSDDERIDADQLDAANQEAKAETIPPDPPPDPDPPQPEVQTAPIPSEDPDPPAPVEPIDGQASLVEGEAIREAAEAQADEAQLAATTMSQSVTTIGGASWKGAKQLSEWLVPIGELTPHPGNPRRGDVPAIAESLRRFGQVRPVLIVLGENESKTIVAGHHVTLAAQSLGWTHVAVNEAEFDSREEAAAYLIADNQLPTLGHVDHKEQLSILDDLADHGGLAGTGFTDEQRQDLHLVEPKSIARRVEIGKLRHHPNNYREHDEHQLKHLTASLKEHGFYRPIVLAKDESTILAGHGLVGAAMNLGLKTIMANVVPYDPTAPQALKIVAADNELMKAGGLNRYDLAELLKKVAEGNPDDLVGTGYDAQALANLVLVVRPSDDIKDHDAAAQWLGLPEFETKEQRVRLTVDFGLTDDRDAKANRDLIVELLAGLQLEEVQEYVLAKQKEHDIEDQHAFHRNEWAWSTWFPDRDFEDLHALRFDHNPEGV